MRLKRLTTRFLLASCLLVAATVTSGVWSAFAFARFAESVDATLRTSQRTIELASSLGTILEREDDALLLSLTGEARSARDDLVRQRRLFDAGFDELRKLLTDSEQIEEARVLETRRDEYRLAGDELL